MSYLDNQLSAFKSNLTSSSTKISNKRTVATQKTSSPSPAPSQASVSSKNDLKRKRPEPTNVVYSQPGNTGTGHNIITQVTYVIEYLKAKGTPQTFPDLLSYLSMQHANNEDRKNLLFIVQHHEKINYNPNGTKGEGTYTFRPAHDIQSRDQLLGHLQAQPTAQGLSVRELKDGWQDAENTINALEAQCKLLVIRNKKDDHPKMVWPDDPSLAVHIDDEFKNIWSKIKLPEPGALADELEKAGLTPTNKARGVKAKVKVQEKKNKKPRRSGKTTNTHMMSVLRDYSHLKK